MYDRLCCMGGDSDLISFGQNNIHFAFDMSAILVCFIVFLFSMIYQRTEKTQNKVFIVLIFIVMVNAVCELVTNYLQPISGKSKILFSLMDYSRLMYFIIHAALCPVFFYYVTCVCGAVSKLNFRHNLFYSMTFVITEIAVLLNPITHWIYHFDEKGEYCRDFAIYAIYIAAAFYFFMAILRLLFSWRALTARRRIALVYFMAIVILGVVIQLIWIDMKVELLAESFGVLGIMLSVENEDDRVDPITGVYNRRALENDLDTCFINKTTLHLLCIKLTNADITERLGNGGTDSVLNAMIADHLRTLFPRYCIYKTSPDTFAVTLFGISDDNIKGISELISERFEKPWIIGGNEVLLNAVVMSANIPLRIGNTSDALYMADSSVPANNEKKILVDSDLDYLLRLSAVEKAIKRGLEDKNFEVYYQPTYCLDEGYSLHGAEALIRLHDPVIGHVYPSEFIPIAEKMGLIDELDDYVLREVCEFLKTGIPAECGMECINVNLSVLQCIRPGFVERIISIVSGFGIEKNMINFEITESVAANDYRILSKTMNSLKREGFLFSMDDYGTGYSNMQSIFSLDFDIIKIDKSILWSAEKGELGKIILENSVRMIRQMNRRILVEGVETEGQIELLRKLGVDYLQGYYFSRPVPKKDFIALIKNRSAGA